MTDRQKAPIAIFENGRFQQKLNILLVEKDWAEQRLVSKMLEFRGCAVIPAANLQEAGNLLENRDVDLVLMDSNIFQNNGYDIRRVIEDAERKSGRRIPIIAFSENFVKDHRDCQMESGMDGYLPKPIFEEELCRVVEQIAGQIQFNPPLATDAYLGDGKKVAVN